MNNPTFYIALAFTILILALAAGISQAPAKTVSVCASIKLPATGKCVHFTKNGYRVRVCK